LSLAAGILACPARAHANDREWQAKAVAKYPSLGVQGSELNQRFLELHNQRRKSDPGFFLNPQWPLILADELAATPLPSSTKVPSESPPQPSKTTAPPDPSRDTRANPTATKTAPASANPAPTPPNRTKPQPTPQAAKPPESPFPVSLVAIGAAVVGIVVLVSAMKAVRRRKHRARLIAEAHQFLESARRDRALQPVPARILLKPGETAFYSAPSILYETRAVRHYQSGSVGFRVAKGIYVGGSKGRSISSQEWSQIDAGTLTITNKRLIFDGGGADRTVALNKVLSAESRMDGVEVSAESRQKSMVFAAENPLILATVIHICCQIPDPLNLSETQLQITFTE